MCSDLVFLVLAALMSVKEMAKGITYDDPIKTRCVLQCGSCLSGNLASLQLTRARRCAAWQEEHCSVATSFTVLPGFMPLYVKSKAAELLRLLFYIQ